MGGCRTQALSTLPTDCALYGAAVLAGDEQVEDMIARRLRDETNSAMGVHVRENFVISQ